MTAREKKAIHAGWSQDRPAANTGSGISCRGCRLKGWRGRVKGLGAERDQPDKTQRPQVRLDAGEESGSRDL